MNNDELLSRTVNFLRLPLIFGVVLIHSRIGTSYVAEGSYPIYTIISHVISNILARVAVPCFFIFSGYFFFRNGGPFTAKAYGEKLKKRSKTVLLPYILWNLLVMGLFLLSEPFSKGLVLENRKLVSDYSTVEFIRAFWDLNKGFPICYQLWFIRDLMVIMVLSPIIYWAIKLCGRYFLWAAAIAWIAKINLLSYGLNMTTILFFSTGAYFGIEGKNFVVESKKWLRIALIAYIVLGTIDTCLLHEQWHWYINRCTKLAGIVATIGLAAHFVENRKWQAIPHLAGIGFFMYAFHGMPLTLATKLAFLHLDPQCDMAVLGLYLAVPLVVISIGFVLYYFTARYLPRLMHLITGGR